MLLEITWRDFHFYLSQYFWRVKSSLSVTRDSSTTASSAVLIAEVFSKRSLPFRLADARYRLDVRLAQYN